jgi:Protein of unknown function (DUF3035)
MMTRKILLTTAASALLLSLSGCGSSGLFGGGKASAIPVSRAAPLVVPPDFALAPVVTNAPRAEGTTQDQVIESLFGGAAPRSASERAIVASAGNADLSIRSTVGDPGTLTINKGSVTRDIIAAPQGDGQAAQAAIPE